MAMAQKGKYAKPKPRKKGKGKFLLLLLLLLGIVLLAVRLMGSSVDPKDLEEQVDPEAVAWTSPQSAPENTGKGIQIPGYGTIPIPAGEETVNLVLLNPEGNPCYFTFALVLKDTEEVLYESALVPPGKAITEVTLNRTFDPGEYPLDICISTTSLADGSAMNGANIETVLVVQ